MTRGRAAALVRRVGDANRAHIDITNIRHQYVIVRTTIAIDDDVVEKLKALARKQRVSLRQVVVETLRKGLGSQSPRAPRRKAFRTRVFRSAFRPGVDPLRLNQLSDDIEALRVSERRR